ncbi:hypothetical protein PPL_06422 [Heterostelium album PN500]|uniref:IPT/TIG domain-containing protein n=1 Tax=Heterostelium pallidum (strain ATCC 26659 / Pp 5 / PN500) TaxID=670386 RepID=D3BD42_HETP5|nr:hypothetical protein PPL_06422 [Heterostelium album PN500]EFA80834.1 hypothetical protein PPL_06422 [Heterostelium album PN500]|eukprot:XP_020432953.1 hypothetical protein PPL_06422 [Heterostelium album PN500]
MGEQLWFDITIREDLYVRKCYIDLWNSLNSLSLPLQRAHLCAGTSGIGKQYLSLYPYEVKEEFEVFQDTFSTSRDQQEAIAKTKENRVTISSAQSVRNPWNGHTYEYINTTMSWNNAKLDAERRGGYLATLTSQNEYYFVRDQVLKNIPIFVWLGANSNNSDSAEGAIFKWATGPEAGMTMFDRTINKCFSYCSWLPYQPDISNNERYLHLWSQNMMNDLIENWSAIQGYILETGGENDPVMLQPDGDAETIVFINLQSYSTSTLTINVKSLNGKTDFTCPIISYNTTTVTCNKQPYYMTGEYNITISDGTNSIVLAKVHPNLPYVSSVIPSPNLRKNEIITINGEGFSDNAADIQVTVSTKNIACGSVRILTYFRSFVCALSADIFSTIPDTSNYGLDYVSVNVNGVRLLNQTRTPFYNKQTSTLFSFSGNEYTSVRPTLWLEGKPAYTYSPYTLSDRQFITQLASALPQMVCFLYNFNNNVFTIQQGPNVGTTVITGTTCTLPGGGPACTVDPTVANANKAIAIAFQPSNNTFYAPTASPGYATIGSCRYYYAYTLTNTVPSFVDPSLVFRIPTKGGQVKFGFNGLRLTSSEYTSQWSLGAATSLVPNFRPLDNQTITATLPPGTGAPAAFKVVADSLVSNNQILIGYIAPTITSVTPNAFIAGMTVQIKGANLGATVTTMVATVTNNGQTYQANKAVYTPHDMYNIDLRAGYGNYTITVTVGGQVSNTITGSYTAPAITGLSQNGLLFTMTATNFAQDASALSISFSTYKAYNIKVVSYTTISFNMPYEISAGANFILSSNGIDSATYSFMMNPYIIYVPPVNISGGVVIAQGAYFNKIINVFFDNSPITKTQINSTAVQITIPAGGGTNHNIIIATQGSNSNTYPYYHLPTITSFVHTGDNTVILNGGGFWVSTLVALPGAAANITATWISISQISAPIPNNIRAGLIVTTSPTAGKEQASIQFNPTPVISSVAPTTLPTTGGNIVLTGKFLSITDNNNNPVNSQITVGPFTCSAPQNTNSDYSTLQCLVPPGSGKDLPITVSLSKVTATGINFSFVAPYISTVTQKGATIEIQGTNFGPLARVVVTLAGKTLTCSQGSDTLVTCQIIPSSTSGDCILSAGGQASNSYTTYLTPQILSMTPALSNASAITVSGNYFRDTIGSTYKGTVGTTVCTQVTNIQNTDTIECKLPSPSDASTVDTTPLVTITIADIDSNSIPYQYSNPTISSVTQNNSYSIVIGGNNLGTSVTSPTVTLGIQTLSCTISTVQFELNCLLDSSSQSGLVTVSNYGTSGTSNLNLKPILTSINSIASGGIVIINGYFVQEVNSVNIGSQTIGLASITKVDLNTISFPLTGSGINKTTTITTTKGQISTSLIFSFLPTVTSISHSGTTFLTISGANFDIDSFITINTKEVHTGAEITETQIIQRVSSTLKNGNLSVTSHSAKTQDQNYKLTPLVDSVTSVPTSGGVVSVFGAYLNSYRADLSNTTITIAIGSMSCAYISDIGDNTGLTCNLGAGTGSNYLVSVTIDGVVSVGTASFSYGKPSISSVTQSLKNITIQGMNLGSNINDLDIQLNSVPLDCTIVEVDTTLDCSVPQNASSGNIIVDVLGQKTNSMNINLSPIIDSMKPAPSNAQSITLTGWYFRNVSSNTYAGTIGNVVFISLKPVTGTDTIVCEINVPSPAEILDNAPIISIEINDKESLNTIAYQYSSPVISTILQNKYKLVINGHTFGNNDLTPEVSFGQISLDCELTSVQTLIECDLPLSVNNSLVSVTGYGGNKDSKFFYLTPIIKSATNVPTSGGNITITADFVNDILTGNTNQYYALINEIVNTTIFVDQSTISIYVGPDYINSFNISITVIGKESNIFSTGYSNPVITDYSQSSNILTVKGESFGTNSVNNTVYLSISNNILKCVVTVDHTEIQCDLNDLKDARGLLQSQSSIFIYLNTPSINSNTVTIYLTPMLNSISNAPVDGGLITIRGYFLNNMANTPQIPMVVMSSVGACQAQSSSNTRVICRVPSGSHGTNNTINVTLTPNSQRSFISQPFAYSAISPVIQQVITNGKFYYPSTGIVTVKGTNFIPKPLAAINIAGSVCTGPTFISSTQYTCEFNGSIPLVKNYGLNVQIDCDGLTDSGDYFYYDQQPVCNPACLNGGECVEGICTCPTGYIGIQCEKKTNNNNGTSPGTVDPDNANFSSNLSVFFSHVRELDQEGNTVLMYPLSKISWKNSTVSDANANEIFSLGIFPETNITITVKSTLYKDATTIYFAGERIDMGANTLKYEVNCSGWNFTSPLNSLQLIYSLSAPSTSENCNGNVDTTTATNDDTDDLRYIEIELNDKIFVTKFSKRIIVDKKVTTTNTKLLQKGDTIFQDSFFTNSNATKIIAVGLTVPSFSQFVAIDPNFSVLINPKNNDSGCSKKKSLWWISLIVVGGAVAIAGTVVAAVMIKKSRAIKKTNSRLSVKLGALN